MHWAERLYCRETKVRSHWVAIPAKNEGKTNDPGVNTPLNPPVLSGNEKVITHNMKIMSALWHTTDPITLKQNHLGPFFGPWN